MNRKKLFIGMAGLVLLLTLVTVYMYIPKNNSLETELLVEGTDISQTELEELEQIYGSNVINPNDIAIDPNAYANKSIITKGWIVQGSSGEYLIQSVRREDVNLLRIEAGDGINLSEYAGSKVPRLVTLTGSLKIPGDDKLLVFMVSAISE